MTVLRKPTLWQVFTSVMAAMFGVQSQRKRELDFTRGRFSDYAVVGVTLMVLFVLMVLAVVRLVLHFVGS